MISETQKWVNEKIKAGYDTGKIRAVLLMSFGVLHTSFTGTEEYFGEL